MIRRLFILMRKELHQQRWVLLAAGAVVVVLGAIVWLGAQGSVATPTDLGQASATMIVFVPVLGLVLGHRIVVREYLAHTQLFVEALPLRPIEMLLAKYAVGLLGTLAPALAFVYLFAFRSSESTLLFWWILTLRVTGYVLVAWSLFFGFGLLGRLRIPAYITLFSGLALLADTTSVELDRFGPLALIDPSTFAYERTSVPLRALLESLLVSGLFVGLGAIIALSREGSLAEKLARRASPTEIVAVAVLLSAELITVAWVSDKAELPPFEFTGAPVLRSAAGDAHIMYAWPAFEARAAVIANAFDALGSRLSGELAAPWRPTIRVAHNSLLEGSEVRPRDSSAHGGVLLETNLGSTDFHLQHLLEHAAHSMFDELSGSRALFEPNHWFLDGFSSWWTSEPYPASKEQLWLRALVARRHRALDTGALPRWNGTIESVGEEGASALAFTLVDVLQHRHGRERAMELARAVLVRRSGTGIGTWLAERRLSLPQRFERLTGEPWPKLVARWQSELQARSRGPLAARLASVPDDRARVWLEQTRSGLDVVYELWGPALSVARHCLLLHAKIPPYDASVDRAALKQRALPWNANEARAGGRAAGLYQRGDRALLIIECHGPGPLSRVRLAAERREAP